MKGAMAMAQSLLLTYVGESPPTAGLIFRSLAAPAAPQPTATTIGSINRGKEEMEVAPADRLRGLGFFPTGSEQGLINFTEKRSPVSDAPNLQRKLVVLSGRI
jgi:hypothetical protein